MRLLAYAHVVVIANARRLPIVYVDRCKADQFDGETLARPSRVGSVCWGQSPTEIATHSGTWLCCRGSGPGHG